MVSKNDKIKVQRYFKKMQDLSFIDKFTYQETKEDKEAKEIYCNEVLNNFSKKVVFLDSK